MAERNTDDTGSTELNVHSAVPAFESLLSADPEYSETEEETTDDVPEEGAETEVETEEQETEQPAEEVESEEADQVEETEEEPELPAKVTVKIDGKDEEVEFDELVRGYSRTADYTRKTQSLAEERKAFQTEKDSVQSERQQYATYLTQLKSALEASNPQEPDWDKLREENPAEFPEKFAEWQIHKKRLEAVEQEQQRTMEKFAQEQMERFKTHLTTEREKLVEALPTWKDAEVAKKEKGELSDFAMNSLGFTADEVAQVSDHRLVVLLRKAMLHDKSEAAKTAAKAKIEKRTVVTKPGVTVKKKKTTELTRRKQRLAKTGNVRDAAAVFESMDLD